MVEPYQTYVDNLFKLSVFSEVEDSDINRVKNRLKMKRCYIIDLLEKIKLDFVLKDNNIYKYVYILEVLIFCIKIYLIEEVGSNVQLFILSIVSLCLNELVTISDIDKIKVLIKKLDISFLLFYRENDSLDDYDVRNKIIYKKFCKEIILYVISFILILCNIEKKQLNYYYFKYFDERYLSI